MEMQERINLAAARAFLMKTQAKPAFAGHSRGRIPQHGSPPDIYQRPEYSLLRTSAEDAGTNGDITNTAELNERYKMAQARYAVRLFYAKRAFDESKHPRASKGNHNGGQFVNTRNLHDSVTNRADLAWAKRILATRPKPVVPHLTPKDINPSKSAERPSDLEAGPAFFSIPPEPLPAKPTTSKQRVRDIQQHIVSRQNGIDALTRQKAKATYELKEIHRLSQLSEGLMSTEDHARIKPLKAQIAYCDNLIRQFRSDVNDHQMQLTPGDRVPELPSLKTMGPRAINGTMPTQSQLLDALQLGDLAAASYAKDDSGKVPVLSKEMQQLGWFREFTYYESSGFHAALFKNLKTGEVVLGFAGTDLYSPADWFADAPQGAGVWTKQYQQAIDLAGELKKKYPNLRLTGHSLGGGLASAASIIHRIGGTVTFNAAGVHPWTLRGHQVSLSDAPGLISSFRVKGDFLSSGQDRRDFFGHLLPVTGTIIAPDGVGTNYWLTASGLNPFSKHSMTSIREGLNRLAPTKNMLLAPPHKKS